MARTRGAFVLASLAVHLTLFLSLHSAAMKAPPIKRQPITLAIIDHPKPLPPPEPPKQIEPKKVPKKREAATPPKKNEPPPPPVFGLQLQATDAQGGFAVPVGNTTLTEPTPNPPKEVRPLQGNGRGPVSLAQLSKLPEKIGECPPGNPNALYTPSARDAGIEGDVVVQTDLDDTGKVIAARIVKGIGYGLDEAAARAVREECRFKPAEVNGDKVGTTIALTFHFIIDD